MLLGQLYHYQKEIKNFEENLDPENVEKIDLCGVKNLDAGDFVGLKKEEIARLLKDKFSAGYAVVLQDNELNFASQFWAALTSPLKKAEIEVQAESDYQSSLVTWLDKETPFGEMESLLSAGSLSTDEEDYACCYGLGVLYELTKAQLQASDEDLFEDELVNSGEGEIATESELLVLCSSYLAPLFTNLNADFDTISESFEVNLEKIKTKIAENSAIKLILLVGENLDEQVLHLEKKLPEGVMVSTISFEGGEDQEIGSYFEKLVGKTLGVRLV